MVGWPGSSWTTWVSQIFRTWSWVALFVLLDIWGIWNARFRICYKMGYNQTTMDRIDKAGTTQEPVYCYVIRGFGANILPTDIIQGSISVFGSLHQTTIKQPWDRIETQEPVYCSVSHGFSVNILPTDNNSRFHINFREYSSNNHQIKLRRFNRPSKAGMRGFYILTQDRG